MKRNKRHKKWNNKNSFSKGQKDFPKYFRNDLKMFSTSGVHVKQSNFSVKTIFMVKSLLALISSIGFVETKVDLRRPAQREEDGRR